MKETAIGIIGAGRQARETAAYLQAAGHDVAFFADELVPAGGARELAGIRYLNIAEIPPQVPVVTALGENALRRRLAGSVSNPFTSCIMSSAYGELKSGEDVTIAPGCILTTGITIGSHVLVNIGCNISHDAVLDDFVTISPAVNLAGRCRIGEGTFIGIGASIIDGITIGRDCIIGAGAAVIRDVPDGVTVAGVPAAPLERQ